MDNQTKTYDVIILTHAPTDLFIDSLKMLLAQSILPEKIIICNTDSNLFLSKISDKRLLDDILKEHSSKQIKPIIEVVHIDESDFDHGQTRNYAASFSTSQYLLFMTDDAVPCDKYLAYNLLDAFEKYKTKDINVATTYARQVPRADVKLSEKYVREYNYPDYDVIKEKAQEKELGIKNYFCSNVCAMYDKSIYLKLGKFDEGLILNEDTFYVYNAINSGYRVVYASNAIVYHSHNFTLTKQFSRNFDIGVSHIDKNDIFESIPSEKEGIKMAKYVISQLIKRFHFFSIFYFVIECLYKYRGFKLGKNYKELTNDQCIKYANNKNYFKHKR